MPYPTTKMTRTRTKCRSALYNQSSNSFARSCRKKTWSCRSRHHYSRCSTKRWRMCIKLSNKTIFRGACMCKPCTSTSYSSKRSPEEKREYGSTQRESDLVDWRYRGPRLVVWIAGAAPELVKSGKKVMHSEKSIKGSEKYSKRKTISKSSRKAVKMENHCKSKSKMATVSPWYPTPSAT